MDKPIIVITVLIAVTLVLLLIVLLIKQNKPDSFKKDTRDSSSAMGKGMGIGIAIGMGTGVALGTTLGNIGVGIAIGAGIGISLGVAFGNAFKKREDEERLLSKGHLSHKQDYNKKLPAFVGVLMVLLGLMFLGLMLFMKMN